MEFFVSLSLQAASQGQTQAAGKMRPARLHAPPPALPKTPKENPYPFLNGELAILEALALALLPLPGKVKPFLSTHDSVLVIWIGIGFRDRTFGYDWIQSTLGRECGLKQGSSFQQRQSLKGADSQGLSCLQHC